MANEILTDVIDGVLMITLNRPEARNAVNKALAEQLAQAIERLDSEPALRVGLIAGAGGTFCSGMDLKAFLAGELPVVPGRGFGGIAESPPKKPLVAAVNGYALAGGFEILLACDLIVANADAKFGIPEAKRGLVAAAGGLMRLPRQISYRLAMELALTGEPITASRAYEMGLINRVVQGDPVEEALRLAGTIADNGPLAVAMSKRVISEQADWSSDESFARQKGIVLPVFSSRDAREGAAAFAEKRAPQWTGN